VAGGAATAAVVALGGGVAIAMGQGSGPAYRLATVTDASVGQSLATVGTIAPVNQATVSFPVSGTVQAVDVRVGQVVAAGSVLATLSTTALQQQVTSDSAAVASAQQTLATDQASQTAVTTTSTSGSSTSGSSTSGSSTSGSGGTTSATKSTASGTSGSGTGAASSATTGKTGTHSGAGSSPAVKAVMQAQQALLKAQRSLDADLTGAEQALQTCKDDLTSATPPSVYQHGASSSPAGPTAAPSTSPVPSPTGSTTGATPTASTTPTAGATPSPSGSGTSGPSAAQVADCVAAIDAAPSQAQSAADKRALSTDEAALTKAIAKLEASAGTTAETSAGATGSTRTGATGTGATGAGAAAAGAAKSSTGSTVAGKSSTSTAGAGSGRSASSGPATAQQLAADQAEIDAANANLAVAQQNLAETTLTSPIAGTIASVGLTAGGSVGASSSGSAITVIGAGQTEVNTTVPLTSIDSVKVGQQASVTVDGQSSPIAGTVTSIGLLSSTTGSTTTYPVTVLLAPTSVHLVDGAGAAVSISIANVSHVLTVPSSAVHVLGTAGTVTVLKNGKATLTRVTLGAIGVDRTQILSGLTAGQQVVLATLNTPLPTANTNSNITRRLGISTGGGALGGAALSGTGSRTGG
jgi:multidrug efflux pump subunit AcrA (membrane-fusion protein)